MTTILSKITRSATLVVALGATSAALAVTQITGAGASFPAPLYQRWAQEFYKANPDIQVNYQSVGSGAGIKQFIVGTVN